MSIFKGHKITVNHLIGYIPEGLLTHLSQTTQVDHYTKVLHGKKMFYLLMYGILAHEKLSQRSLEDTFNDPVFKVLFHLDEQESVRRSSISERLSKIDPAFFKQAYECIYEQFAELYAPNEREKYHLIRVDSTMVSETVGKLVEGMDNKSGKKAIKYSIAFDGLLPCQGEVFTSAEYGSEDMALPQVVMNHVKKQTHHNNIYVLDRGLQSTRSMDTFTQKEITFVCRAKENRKYVELASLILADQELDLGDSILIKDAKVQLYTGQAKKSKKQTSYYQQALVDQEFRMIIIENKSDHKQYVFLTNDFKRPAREIAEAYRRRWDIEIFFRFLKQELNVSHLISLNKNGIQVMLYMTLIVAMMVLIYKKANGLSYKTAKRRFAIEVRNLAIAMIVVRCGGNPDRMFKT
jgi:hypothetical protein